jgi:hypothetical protein
MCLSTFTKKANLEAHLVEDHGVDPPYIWVVWSAYFFGEKAFETHIKKHENQQPIRAKNKLTNVKQENERSPLKLKDENLHFDSSDEDQNGNTASTSKKNKGNLTKFTFPTKIGKEYPRPKVLNMGKRDFSDDFWYRVKPPVYDPDHDIVDPMLMGQSKASKEFLKAASQNTVGLDIERTTSFGFPVKSNKHDLNSKPTTSLYDELWVGENFISFNTSIDSPDEEDDSDSQKDAAHVLMESAVYE